MVAMSALPLPFRPQPVAPPAPEPAPTYLNAAYGVKLWLLTTDHKRIGLLYLVSVTLMFLLGGVAAPLIRINLLTPHGTMFAADTYNKMFSAHGIIMVWFFLVPVVPNVLGNFLLPMMIGARDLAFPRLNLASWYVYIVAAALILWVIFSGGDDNRRPRVTPSTAKAGPPHGYPGHTATPSTRL